MIEFLRQLLHQTRRPLFVLWDGVQPHRAVPVQRFIAQHRRLHVCRLPAYCPDLNPNEWFWSSLKRQLANLSPADANDLRRAIRNGVACIRAKSWKKARRVVAKVEFQMAEA